jgi:hydrogenase maturation protein HypF
LDVSPVYVVHDRHPDFFSSRLARRFAAERDLPCLAVQHHHAHSAAVMAEHGLEGPALSVALDGLGWGEDGGLWGGELLKLEGAHYRRLAHLHPLALPGGDRAAREPWRMAVSVLHALGRHQEIPRRFTEAAAETVVKMLDQNFNAPLTSSAGRWFDAAAGLLGVVHRTSYEGQAAMLLESLAMRHGPVAPDRDVYGVEQDGVLNLLPLLDRLAREQDSAYGAALFHATLVAALNEWVQRAATRESVRDVMLSGGCFMNGILNEGLRAALRAAGLNVYSARRLPPNDGGLSLGQAWVGCCTAIAAGAPSGNGGVSG